MQGNSSKTKRKRLFLMTIVNGDVCIPELKA